MENSKIKVSWPNKTVAGLSEVPNTGNFQENLLLLAWHTYRVFIVLGPVLKHIVTLANFSALVNKVVH